MSTDGLRHCVYVLADERGARYVGLTRVDPVQRWRVHCASALSLKGGEYRDRSRRAQWIRSLHDRGEKPRMIILASELTGAEAASIEREIIAARPDFLNEHAGGGTGRGPSTEADYWSIDQSRIIATIYMEESAAVVATAIRTLTGYSDLTDEVAVMYGCGKLHPRSHDFDELMGRTFQLLIECAQATR